MIPGIAIKEIDRDDSVGCLNSAKEFFLFGHTGGNRLLRHDMLLLIERLLDELGANVSKRENPDHVDFSMTGDASRVSCCLYAWD